MACLSSSWVDQCQKLLFVLDKLDTYVSKYHMSVNLMHDMLVCVLCWPFPSCWGRAGIDTDKILKNTTSVTCIIHICHPLVSVPVGHNPPTLGMLFPKNSQMTNTWMSSYPFGLWQQCLKQGVSQPRSISNKEAVTLIDWVMF